IGLQALARDREDMLASRSWRATEGLRRFTTWLRQLRLGLGYRRKRIASALARTRGSLARRGMVPTIRRALLELRRTSLHLTPMLDGEPSKVFEPFTLPTSKRPRASIVIPVYNKIEYTVACLRSLVDHAGRLPFEVIVVDDGSVDDTPRCLREIDGLRALRNRKNLGFVGSCNAGAAAAKGEFIVFLNNDTVVTAGWLEALLDTFDQVPEAGLVGARLVYPDGRLQEAGGIVFNDGSGWNYGRFGDPRDPRYSFRREVDYCSGAAIAIRRALFDQLGRFDERYAPAYYEDTDLAFAVRNTGYKVIYQPAATVIHFEGITAGTDTGSGVKQYQIVNREKFLEKWADALRQQPKPHPQTPIGIAATHRATRRALIIDATTPAPDQDSGSVRMVNFIRVLIDLGTQVTFMAENRAWVERDTTALQQLGVEVLFHPYVSDPVALFRERGAEFDVILLSRHYIAVNYLALVREYAPQARLLFDTVDLHYLREQREAELADRDDLRRTAAVTRGQEIRIMRDSDITLVVSPVEQELLRTDAPDVRVEILSNVHEVFGCRKPFAERHDLVFVGGFQHPPNIDAVDWFVKAVFPLVRPALPGVRFHVIGSKIIDEVLALAADDVIVHGYVEDIAPFMDDCRISVAPLRYGAGVKGKVNMAMSYGLPVAATAIAVEGMHVRIGEDVLVADDAAGLANEIIRLYSDEALWNQLSANGLANVESHFSFATARVAVQRFLS
ncbi:MAG: glycosyltransferase, partial [Dokdonella sp.]